MAASHHSIITNGLTDVEKGMVDRATIKAAAPSSDSALLGAVALLRLLKAAGLEIPAEIAAEAANPITTLEDWTIGVDGSRTIVVGSVKDDAHGRFRDGEIIHTSRISTDRRALRDGVVVQTRNSRYRLGRRAISIPAGHRALVDQSGYDLLAPRG